ncbi:succinate dehydrogenase assembly factor 3, mitochondrial-like isoform X2 [Penaeus chinensis]|uniref:succinate dehydrogenase assembly factor 3, mitochondrial-like isoform X2 n=1 Tax=Penaeus chinensis TaxID=139456 RepID=UPI001FB71F1D|nr:succinate dehydrogenase assembly factor 3, mitochondrial-like isoform X2 [Penaeus chinensis]
MGGGAAIQQVFTHAQRVRLLYKTILKLHRGFPVELKALGDQYTRDEFRRHKNATPEQTQAFMVEWTNYAITIAKQLGVRGAHMSKTFGQNFKVSDLENFNDEQVYQLYELYKASVEADNGNQKES